jgi:hypothetical protein
MLSDAVGEVVCKWRGDETKLDDGEGQHAACNKITIILLALCTG